MNIISLNTAPVSRLIHELKQVSMLKDNLSLPYQNALISVEKMALQSLSAAQRYVLRSEFNKVKDLRFAMLRQWDIDILNLDDSGCGYLDFTVEGHEGTITLLPPIVEESFENGGVVHNIVGDGMHRIMLAWMCDITPSVAFIRGVDKRFPYYAYPMKDADWNDIDFLDEIPPGYLKKMHRIEDNKRLYRNFNPVGNGSVGGPRGGAVK